MIRAAGRGGAGGAGAYSVRPEEHLLRPSIVTSLFPQLRAGSHAAYRTALGLVVVLLVAMATARLEAPVIAVSALAVPLLFLVYVYEIAPLAEGLAGRTAATFLAGAALGVGWALLLGPVVAGSLLPGLAVPLVTATFLVSAVAVPAAGQVLMLVPVAAARPRRPQRGQALDGFTAGAASALGLTMAATLTELAPLLRAGNFIRGSSVLASITLAVVRGVSLPVVAAAATGYAGAALWSRRARGPVARGPAARGPAAGRPWLARPVAALALALVVQIALGIADDAGLPDGALLAIHLAAAAAALLVLRVGLHHVVGHEQPAAAAAPGQAAAARQLGHRGVLAVLIGGLTAATVVLAVLAVVVPPAPATPCTALRCFAPFGVPPHPPHVYTSAQGWSVQWYPANAVLSQQAPVTSATTYPDQLQLDFTNQADPAEDGQLAFVGAPARGKSAAQIVTALQQANAPNAVPDYVLPGPSVGYVPGHGEAYQTAPNSADGNPVRFEVVITCAIRNQYAICAYAAGPQVNLNSVVTHPTEAKLALSLWGDSDLNGVRWKGQGPPH